jgi:hypothetical protein
VQKANIFDNNFVSNKKSRKGIASTKRKEKTPALKK